MATKIQVVFYSMYGHIYRMAEAVVAGASEVAGTEVALYQVAELVPDDVLDRPVPQQTEIESYSITSVLASANWKRARPFSSKRFLHWVLVL